MALTLNSSRKSEWDSIKLRTLSIEATSQAIELPGFVPEKCLWPREAGNFVAENAKMIKLNDDAVKKVAELVYESAKKNALEHCDYHAHVLHPKFEKPEHTARWVFFADTLNFAFWCYDGSKVEYNEEMYSGYYSIAAVMKKALDRGLYNFLDPHFWRKFNKSDAEQLFGDHLPLVGLRIKALNEAGRIITEKYGGLVLNLIKSAGGSAVRLVRILATEFTSYRDGVQWKNHKLLFLKRAQIFTADVYSALRNDQRVPFVRFADIGKLTMFADYRVPQVLCHLGVLEYSDEIKKILWEYRLLKPGSRVELEIRGMSIFACDRITVEVNRLVEERGGGLKEPVTDADTDVFLWLHRRQNAEAVDKTIPHHLVVSWFY